MLPQASAADNSNYAFFAGSGEGKKAIADTWNNKDDSYKDGGWKAMSVYVKDLAGTGATRLNFDSKMTMEIACKGGTGPGDGDCESREPIFTAKLYCMLPEKKFQKNKEGLTGGKVYYEFIYAVGLKDNGKSGDDFVNRKDYNGTAGIIKTTKYESAAAGEYTRPKVTRDMSNAGRSVDNLDDKRVEHKNGREDDDWGVDEPDKGCRPPGAITGKVKMASYDKASEDDKKAFNPSGDTSATGATDESESGTDDSCDAKLQNPISWIVCPVVDAAGTMVQQMETIINRTLTVDTFTSTEGDDQEVQQAYYRSWSNFRNIALGLIAIVALVVIIATAFGYELLDAYTVRKVLPRLLIAVIFITLSWNILLFLIMLSNDVGNGIRALIYAPFSNLGGSYQLGDSGGFVVALISGGAVTVLGALGFLSFGLTAAVGTLIAFCVLMFRELAVVFLTIMAPIAIVMMILPNTKKAWDMWRNAFFALLIIFPVISAMIAVGRVFALTTAPNGAESGTFAQIVAFIAYFLPYFLLGFVITRIGGVAGALNNVLKQGAAPINKAAQGYRQNKTGTNLAAMKSGTRFNEAGNFIPGSARVARRFNRTSGALGTGMQGHFGLGERGAQAVSQKDELNALENVMKNPRWNAVNNNDDGLRAMTYGSADEAKQGLTSLGWSEQRANAAVQAARASVGFGGAQQVAAARQLVTTGTGYDDVNDMASVLGRASGGNSSTAASLAGFANSETKRVGRGDLAPSFGTLNNLTQQAGNTRYANKAGAPGMGDVGTSIQDNATVMKNAWESQSLYAHGNGKPQAIKNFAQHYENQLRTGDQKSQIEALTFFQDLSNMKSGSNGAISSEISDILGRNQQVIQQVGQQADATSYETIDAQGTSTSQQKPVTIPMAPQTLMDEARNRARSYREPNPNDRN